ncbi:MAG: AMP-binding protein [Kiritimatiellae bacterium]|nr:AMP-binding protein [Kiritimatiellia bacterium]
MNLLGKFLPKTSFDSYEDFRASFRYAPPPRYNFAYDVVDVYAREAPGQLALLWAAEDDSFHRFTFADMKRMSDKAANVFAAHGIRKGDAVMLTLKNRCEFWFCMMGLHKLGALAIPATHMLTDHDLVYRFRAADVKMLVAANEECLLSYAEKAVAAMDGGAPRLALVAGNGPRAGWLDFSAELEAASDAWEKPAGFACDRDPMLAYFSSGTTGEPKMVLHDYFYSLGHIVTSRFWHNDTEGGLHYTVADTGWGKAVWGNLYGQWISGSGVFVHDYARFLASKTLALVARAGVTSFCAPPTVYRFLIKEDMSKYDFSTLRYACVAGEPLNPEVYDRFLEATGIKLMESYGQTETTLSVGNFLWMEPKKGSMGRPSPVYNVRLIRKDGTDCDVGEEGEMVIPLPENPAERPFGLFRGYVGNPEATADAQRGGVYHTGDVAWKDEDGYFWYVGRDDDLIKSSGYRIGPFEVESALMAHPAVLECAVTGAPDPVRGQIVKATIVLSKGYEGYYGDAAKLDGLTKDLQEHVKHATAPYKYPRKIEYVKELPKTISGKIQRKVIREHDRRA